VERCGALAIEIMRKQQEEVIPVDYPKPPYPSQKQPMPGTTAKMDPRPDHGETSYKGLGRLEGMKAVITGGDSGIGRAVAIANERGRRGPNCVSERK
jgi:hypothetical protein